MNVRSGQGSTNGVVGKFPKGTKVQLVEKNDNGWYKVKTDELEGFVSSDYLTFIK